MTRRFRLSAAGLCALLAAGLCLAYGEQVRAESERQRTEALERYGGEVVTLVVATEDIEAGETVDEGNAAERDWLVDLAPVDAVTGLEEVLGAELSVPVAGGTPLTALNFRATADAVEVPAGRVAVSVPIVDDLGLPGATSAGDALAAYAVSDDGVRLVTSDLRVLAVSQTGSGLVETGELTLAVDPVDVAALLAASGEGSLRLALPGAGALAEVDAGSAPVSVPPEADEAGTSEESSGDEADGSGGDGA